MAVLVLAEVNGAELAIDATAKAVTAAKSLGDVTVLCASSGCGGAAARLQSWMGFQKFYVRMTLRMATVWQSQSPT